MFLTVAAAPEHMWRGVGFNESLSPADGVGLPGDEGLLVDEMLVPVGYSGEIKLVESTTVNSANSPNVLAWVMLNGKPLPTKILERDYIPPDRTRYEYKTSYGFGALVAEFTFRPEDRFQPQVCEAYRKLTYGQSESEDKRSVTFIPVSNGDIAAWSQFHQQFKQWSDYHRLRLWVPTVRRYFVVLVSFAVVYLMVSVAMVMSFRRAIVEHRLASSDGQGLRRHPAFSGVAHLYSMYCLAFLTLTVFMLIAFPFKESQAYYIHTFVESSSFIEVP